MKVMSVLEVVKGYFQLLKCFWIRSDVKDFTSMNMDVDIITATIMTVIIFLFIEGNSIKFIYPICDIYIILTDYAVYP